MIVIEPIEYNAQNLYGFINISGKKKKDNDIRQKPVAIINIPI